MKHYTLSAPCIINQFDKHDALKDLLLSQICSGKADELKLINEYHSNFIHRLEERRVGSADVCSSDLMHH